MLLLVAASKDVATRGDATKSGVDGVHVAGLLLPEDLRGRFRGVVVENDVDGRQSDDSTAKVGSETFSLEAATGGGVVANNRRRGLRRSIVAGKGRKNAAFEG